MIERFGFDADAEPYLLNRGTRQLLALASIIVLAPPTIILDEPTTGLDFRECVKVMDVVRERTRTAPRSLWSATTWKWWETSLAASLP